MVGLILLILRDFAGRRKNGVTRVWSLSREHRSELHSELLLMLGKELADALYAVA